MIKFQFHKSDTEKQRNTVLDNFYEKFYLALKDEDIEVVIKSLKKSPSDKQRAYLFGYLFENIKKCLIYKIGWNYPDNEIGTEMTREFLQKHLKFTTRKSNKLRKRYYHIDVNESLSNSKGDKQKVRKFIDDCLLFAAEELGLYLETPEKFKTKRGIK